jgi:hypothetical protein
MIKWLPFSGAVVALCWFGYSLGPDPALIKTANILPDGVRESCLPRLEAIGKATHGLDPRAAYQFALFACTVERDLADKMAGKPKRPWPASVYKPGPGDGTIAQTPWPR